MEKYERKKLPMHKNQILFFDPHMFHRSGHNSTNDEIRFSLVGMWNDTTYHKFRAPSPKFQSRTISAKKYFDIIQKK